MQTQVTLSSVSFNQCFQSVLYDLVLDIWCCYKSMISFAKIFKTVAQKSLIHFLTILVQSFCLLVTQSSVDSFVILTNGGGKGVM